MNQYYVGIMVILSYYGERNMHEAHSRIITRSGHGHFTLLTDDDDRSYLVFSGKLWDMFGSYGPHEIVTY